MKRYIDIDKLIAEIEGMYINMLRHIKMDGGNSDYWTGNADTCKSIIDTVTSLQQYQFNPDREAEIKKMIYEPLYDLGGVAIKGATKYITVEDVADLARHFYELGLNAREEE